MLLSPSASILAPRSVVGAAAVKADAIAPAEPESSAAKKDEDRRILCCAGKVCCATSASVAFVAVAVAAFAAFAMTGDSGADDGSDSFRPLPGSSGGAGLDGVRNVSDAFGGDCGSGESRSLADAAMDEQYEGFTIASFGFNATGMNATSRCNMTDAISRSARSQLPLPTGPTAETSGERDVFVSLLDAEGGPASAGPLLYTPMVATMAVMVSSESDALAVVETLTS